MRAAELEACVATQRCAAAVHGSPGLGPEETPGKSCAPFPQRYVCLKMAQDAVAPRHVPFSAAGHVEMEQVMGVGGRCQQRRPGECPVVPAYACPAHAAGGGVWWAGGSVPPGRRASRPSARNGSVSPVCRLFACPVLFAVRPVARRCLVPSRRLPVCVAYTGVICGERQETP